MQDRSVGGDSVPEPSKRQLSEEVWKFDKMRETALAIVHWNRQESQELMALVAQAWAVRPRPPKSSRL